MEDRITYINNTINNTYGVNTDITSLTLPYEGCNVNCWTTTKAMLLHPYVTEEYKQITFETARIQTREIETFVSTEHPTLSDTEYEEIIEVSVNLSVMANIFKTHGVWNEYAKHTTELLKQIDTAELVRQYIGNPRTPMEIGNEFFENKNVQAIYLELLNMQQMQTNTHLQNIKTSIIANWMDYDIDTMIYRKSIFETVMKSVNWYNASLNMAYRDMLIIANIAFNAKEIENVVGNELENIAFKYANFIAFWTPEVADCDMLDKFLKHCNENKDQQPEWLIKGINLFNPVEETKKEVINEYYYIYFSKTKEHIAKKGILHLTERDGRYALIWLKNDETVTTLMKSSNLANLYEEIDKHFVYYKLTEEDIKENSDITNFKPTKEQKENAYKEIKETFDPKETAKKISNVITKNIMDNATTNLNAVKESITRMMRDLHNYYEEKLKFEGILETTKLTEETTIKFEKELAEIKENKHTQTLICDENKLTIITDYLYINEPKQNKMYALGEMQITIPLEYQTNQQNIKMFNLTDVRKGYSGDCQHPHVFADGNICWGNMASMVAQYSIEKMFYALYVSILAFLQTCNVQDVAGRYILAWDEVDPKTKEIITKGIANKQYGHNEPRTGGLRRRCEERINYDRYDVENEGDLRCEVCGEIYSEEDMYECENCGILACPDCRNYHEEIDQSICEYCSDNWEYYCNMCDCMLREDEGHYVDDIGLVCESCMDDNTTCCDYCDDRFRNEDLTLVYEYEAGTADICESCLHNCLVDGHIITCPHCESYTYIEETHICGNCGENTDLDDEETHTGSPF